MPWFQERSSSKFFCLTQWWIVTDVWELSQPFTKISLLCFTRSKGLGNRTLKELDRGRGEWVGNEKGLLPAAVPTALTQEELSEKGLSLFWPLHYQGEEWILCCSTSPRKHSQCPWVGLSMGAECHTAVSACTHCSSSLLSWEFIPSLLLQENTVICMY